jgi:Uma2 family endonuclease
MQAANKKTEKSDAGPIGLGPYVELPASALTFPGFMKWVHSDECPDRRRVSFLSTKVFLEMDPQWPALAIPTSARTGRGFREWALSRDFPDHGKISYANEKLFIDMSPEEIETHAKVKLAVDVGIANLNEEMDSGEYFPDGTLVTNPEAGLYTLPDGTFVKWATSASGRVKFTSRKDRAGQYIELRGTPDWVLEVVSFWSVKKDLEEMPAVYHRARIPELWRIDARGPEIDFQILVRGRGKYKVVTGQNSWFFSPVFDRFFRLVRRPNRQGRWNYKLEVKAE